MTLLADLHRGSDPLWVPCSRPREHGVSRLQDSLGHAHEDVSMASKSLECHHLRCNTWGRGGDQRGLSINETSCWVYLVDKLSPPGAPVPDPDILQYR